MPVSGKVDIQFLTPFVKFLLCTSLASVEADSHGFEAGEHLTGERCISSSAIQGNYNNPNGQLESLPFNYFARLLTHYRSRP